MKDDRHEHDASRRHSGRRRSSRHLRKLSRHPVIGRSILINHLHRVVDALAPTTKHPLIAAFLSTNIFAWIGSYLKYVFEPRHPFQTYAGANKDGVYRLATPPGEAITIAITADWATGTDEATAVAAQMAAATPDLTLHLGDVYYVGDADEVAQNFLGEQRNGYDGVRWPSGRRGTFALNGNHEMYANGTPYFETMLKRCGMAGDAEGQVASFFCLEFSHWRIIGLDTGYNSVGVPILSMIPGIKNIPGIEGDCELEQALLDWLDSVVRVKDWPMATVLLSHHQYFSAFPDQNYPRPAEQLASYFPNQELVWLWGHEHRLGIYDPFQAPEGLTFYGRCIGHGGMPVELAEPDRSRAPLALYDRDTRHTLDDGTIVGENGFALATIRGAELGIEYRDTRNAVVFTETFTANGDGRLTYANRGPGVLKPPA